MQPDKNTKKIEQIEKVSKSQEQITQSIADVIEKSGVIDPGNPEESDPCNPAKLTHPWIC